MRERKSCEEGLVVAAAVTPFGCYSAQKQAASLFPPWPGWVAHNLGPPA